VAYNNDVATHSLYLHWPFCKYRCHFCPFVALASHQEFMERYNKALITQMELLSSSCPSRWDIDTIFIGGGTPSIWPNALMLDMFGKLKSVFNLMETVEVTMEVNPGTIEKGQFDFWKGIGINRLSVGVQSLNDSVLRKLNRFQTAKDVYRLFDQARSIFDNISIDLILGLPGVSNHEWKDLLKQVVCWPIKHISIYFLTVHESTQLYFGVKSKKVELPSDDNMVDLYGWSIDFLSKSGFEQYEISNFAKPGYRCKHNEVYWNRKPYKGFGLGACSFDGTTRFQSHKSLMPYLEGVEGGKNIESFTEKLTDKDIRAEKLMLGLRRSKGVLKEEVFNGLSDIDKQKVASELSYLKLHKFIYEKNGRLTLSPSALSVANEVVVRLLL